ncbi:hypothetical protein XarzCFBP7410_00380 [Xanthomonas arboricola pv. zantedeschiae]|nr:hypothetical protein XarzCFBP7410_00380 [Xanthomonas arboricola pv. zantedeschiae]
MHKAVDKWVQAPACNAVKMGGEKMTSRSQMHFSGPDRSDLDRIGKVGCAVGDEMCRPGLRHTNAACRACGSCESCRPYARCMRCGRYTSTERDTSASRSVFSSFDTPRTPHTHYTRRATNRPATASSHARANTLR